MIVSTVTTVYASSPLSHIPFYHSHPLPSLMFTFLIIFFRKGGWVFGEQSADDTEWQKSVNSHTIWAGTKTSISL